MWPLLLVVAAGAVVWTVAVYRATRPAVTVRLRRTLVALRGAAFVLLVLAVAAPVVSRLAMDREPAELLVVVEDSASMDVADAAGGLTRWARAGRLVATLDSLARVDGRRVRVTALAGNGLGGLEPFVAEATPDSRGTDLNALADLARRRAAGQPVRAVVLVSDGQETRSGGAARGPATALPQLVVGVGDPEGPADRVIRDLRYPDTVHRGDEILVEMLIDHRHAEGTGAADLRVTLTGPRGVLADTLLGPVAGAVPLTLAVPATEEGLLVAQLQVSPLVNERFLANNTASLAVDVRRARARVLLLADRPGWDVRFLAQAAAVESRLDLTVVHPTARGMVRADSLTLWTPPAGMAQWLAWDAVVLTGWRDALGGLDWAGLAAAVRQGRGLLVLPGAGSDLPGRPGRPPTDLAGLLPVDGGPDWIWQPGSWRVGGVGDQRHPLLGGRGTRVGPLAAGAGPAAGAGHGRRADAAGGRPPEGGGRGRRAAPAGGRAGRRRAGGLVRRSSPVGAGVRRGRQRPGGSRGAESGEGAGRRLLRNLLVWIAAGDQESGLGFVGRQTVHPEGEPIRLGARWRDIRGGPVVGRAATVLVRRADADSARVAARTYSLQPAAEGQLEAVLPPLPPGRYSATLQGAGDPPVTGATLTFVVAGQSVEAGQVRRDQRRLELWARSLDAVLVDGDGDDPAAALAAALAPVDWTESLTPRRQRLDLWSGWPFLTLVVGLLGCEWFLRRRHGLL